MDIVLGVSMTPTTVRMVLVEGEKADGVTVDHDVFDIRPADGSATSNAAEQVASAVLGTQEGAAASGHHLKSIGVTWTHHSDAAALRDILAARGIEDVMLVSATHAAASLAQAVGRAIGYDTTALLFIEKDTATMSVVQTEDGSVVKVLSRDLHDSDAMAVFTDMAKAVESAESPPQGLFIVGSGVDAGAVKAHLENLVALPVSAPDEPELALARGAALASAHAPEMEASTAGLAYSQDHDGTTAASAYPELAGAVTQMAGIATQMAPVDAGAAKAYSDALAYSDEVEVAEPEAFYEDESRKPFLLVGSALTSIFVVGVVALVISLAVSIRPTVDQRPSPGETPVIPSQAAPAPVEQFAPAVPAPAPAPAAPPPEIIKAPVPVVQQAPRTVFVEKPAPAAALPPAPAAPPPAPVPAAPVAPPVLAPPIYNPPVYNPQPPIYYPQRPVWVPPWQRPSQKPPWDPPWDPPQQIPDPPQQSPQYPGSGSGGYPRSGGSGSGGYPGSGGSGSGGYPGSGSGGSGSGDYGGGGSGSRGGGGPSICVLGLCTGGH